MNTGVQRSGATPPAARTATTQAVGAEPGNVFGQGKSAPLIAMAHEIPYVATATVAELRDLEAKVAARDGDPRRALPARPRPLPARLGQRLQGHDPGRAAGARRRACSRCSRREHGEVTGGLEDPPPGARSRSTCGCRAASRTCSSPSRARRDRAHPGGRRPQHRALRAARRRSPLAATRGLMDKPFAITLDVGSSLANKTGSWRDERPVYVAPPAAVQPRLPGRREHPAVALPRRGRRLRGGLARARARTTRCPP